MTAIRKVSRKSEVTYWIAIIFCRLGPIGSGWSRFVTLGSVLPRLLDGTRRSKSGQDETGRIAFGGNRPDVARPVQMYVCTNLSTLDIVFNYNEWSHWYSRRQVEGLLEQCVCYDITAPNICHTESKD